MKDYGYCYDVLLRVVIEGEPFNNAVQIILSENEKRLIDPKLKSTVFAAVGSTLRHYYVFKEVITRQYKDISEEHMLLIALGIANKLFAKRFDKVKLNQFIVKETGLAGAPMFILFPAPIAEMIGILFLFASSIIDNFAVTVSTQSTT